MRQQQMRDRLVRKRVADHAAVDVLPVQHHQPARQAGQRRILGKQPILQLQCARFGIEHAHAMPGQMLGLEIQMQKALVSTDMPRRFVLGRQHAEPVRRALAIRCVAPIGGMAAFEIHRHRVVAGTRVGGIVVPIAPERESQAIAEHTRAFERRTRLGERGKHCVVVQRLRGRRAGQTIGRRHRITGVRGGRDVYGGVGSIGGAGGRRPAGDGHAATLAQFGRCRRASGRLRQRRNGYARAAKKGGSTALADYAPCSINAPRRPFLTAAARPDDRAADRDWSAAGTASSMRPPPAACPRRPAARRLRAPAAPP